MLLIFFDEVKTQPHYPIYHIGGVCIDEPHLVEIEAEIAAIAQDVFGTTRLSKKTELHMQQIYARSGEFGTMNNFEDRVRIIERFMRILSRPEVKLIDVQIDSLHPKASARPAEIAFMFFCERADQYAASEDKLAMLIGDRESDKIAERSSVSLSNYRIFGTEFQFGRKKITNLFESVHFTHSHLSRFLQLADAYTWIRQFVGNNSNSENARHRAILDLLKVEENKMYAAKYKHWPTKNAW